MLTKTAIRNFRAMIREALIKARSEKDKPYEGETVVIGGKKYAPIEYYEDELGGINATYLPAEIVYLSNAYTVIKGIQETHRKDFEKIIGGTNLLAEFYS